MIRKQSKVNQRLSAQDQRRLKDLGGSWKD